ncbi:hypothetical protein ACQP2Y_15455 [Actinoplanes sp. CA-051413]|uniref:hypothetical protein n=1 Tax=Actinoplanes sp. CA-051413 TaxID=3239899 RepID=UPI003D96585C
MGPTDAVRLRFLPETLLPSPDEPVGELHDGPRRGAQILEKLGCANRTQAGLLAEAAGLSAQ